MKYCWADQELNEHWLLTEEELLLLKGKLTSGKLFFCILLKEYQRTGFFPTDITKTPESVIDFLSHQIGVKKQSPKDLFAFDRTLRDYCFEIRSFLKIKRFDVQAKKLFMEWGISSLFQSAPDNKLLDSQVSGWFLENKYEKPPKNTLNRLLASAENLFENNLFEKISGKLSAENKIKLNNILETSENISSFSLLRKDSGPINVLSVLDAIKKLNLLREIGLPKHLLSGVHPNLKDRYKLRVSSDDVWELKRYSSISRVVLLSFYCIERETEIIDGLVELLINIVHKIYVRSERKVVSDLVGDITKVHGKTNLLFRIAEAINDNSNDSIREVIFPVVTEERIAELVKEYRSAGPSYVKKIYTKIRSSYANHYRRILPLILNSLNFRSNNKLWQPILKALSLLQDPSLKNLRYLNIDDIPFEGVILKKWCNYIIEEDSHRKKRVNRINYEEVVLRNQTGC